jgi:hypothetical protein
MTPDKMLTCSIAITVFTAVLDYILINDHPYPLESNDKKEKKKETFEENFSDDDIEDIINSYDDESENDANTGDMYNPHVAHVPNMKSSEYDNPRHKNSRYYSTSDMYR